MKPDTCSSCAAPLSGDDSAPLRHQVVDIPPIKPRVVEYELHRLECAACGGSNHASLPAGAHQSSFGPNLTALVGQLTGQHRLSRRRAQRFIADTYGIVVSLGAISNTECRLTEGMAPAHAKALDSVLKSATKHLDETTWRASNEMAWAWAGVGEKATVFLIRATRSRDVCKELIGEVPSGVLIADRYGVYVYVGIEQRQVCLAHIIRDFRRITEGEKEHRWIGVRLGALMDALFRIWHLHRDGKITRPDSRRWARPIRAHVIRLLDEAARSRGYETPSMCRGILRTKPAMWTFLDVEGVEPTNNAAERALRPLVIHRKISPGSQSERGARFIEYSHTVAETLRRSGRGLHEFVTAVAKAVLGGGPVPQLLV